MSKLTFIFGYLVTIAPVICLLGTKNGEFPAIYNEHHGYLPCHYQFLNQTYRVTCSHIHLMEIPKCRQLNITNCASVSQLDISGNDIQQLNKGAFTEFPNLTLLDMSYNPLFRIQNGDFQGLNKLQTLKLYQASPQGGDYQTLMDKDIFRPLQNLKYLDLSECKINASQLLLEILCSLPASVETLLMDRVFYRTATHFNFVMLDKTMSKCFKHLNLKKLSLRANKIIEVTPEFIMNVRHLEYLTLRDNNIVGDRSTIPTLLVATNLTFLDLGCQSMWTCDENYKTGVDISQYQTKSSYMKPIQGQSNTTEVFFFKKLTTLRMDHYAGSKIIGDIPDICWMNNHVVHWDVSYVNVVKISGTLKCLWNLKFLNMRGIRANKIDPLLFQDLISLEILLLAESYPGKMLGHESASKIFQYTPNLVYLELAKNGITSLNVELFQNLENLRVLNLSNNFIYNIDCNLTALTSLEYAALSDNLFEKLPWKIITILKRNVNLKNISATLDISWNPFRCTCPFLLDLLALYKLKITILHLNSTEGQLTCVLPNGTSIPFVQAVHKEILSFCGNLTLLHSVWPLFHLCLILVIISSLSYGYRWKIKYTWHTLLTSFYKQEYNRNDFRFDAFVSYCTQDENWVVPKIIVKLEEDEKLKYKLCLHYKHFVAGRVITDNIAAAVAASRRTLLVVTKNYLQSPWSHFEINFAQSHHIQNYSGSRGLIAILHPNVFSVRGRGHDAMVLNRLLDSVTYIEWPVKEEKRDVFWLKLSRLLGSPMRRLDESDDELLEF